MTTGSDRGVAPVVGVALMIAITTLLAASVGVMATGMSSGALVDVPQAGFEVEFENTPPGEADALSVVHVGGDAVDRGNLRFVVRGAVADDGPDAACPASTTGASAWVSAGSGPLSAGDGATVTSPLFETASTGALPADCDGDGDVDHVELDGAAVRLVWQEGDESAVLATWRGPDA
jgi:flagellin-like protein